MDELLADYKKPEDIIGENGLLKQLTKAILERALQTELTEHVGYEKHDPAGHHSGNSRNGITKKKLKGDFGEIDLETPRDRNGSFEPAIVSKGQSRFSGFDDKIISMYSRRMPALSRPELLKLWQELFGKPAAAGIRRELLIPCLVYRLQERVYGRPTPEQQMELQRATHAFGTASGHNLGMRIKPGTRILRKGREQMHEVLVTRKGYEYRGVCYKSLPVIARQITHKRWSGPAFFGLRKPCRAPRKDE